MCITYYMPRYAGTCRSASTKALSSSGDTPLISCHRPLPSPCRCGRWPYEYASTTLTLSIQTIRSLLLPRKYFESVCKGRATLVYHKPLRTRSRKIPLRGNQGPQPREAGSRVTNSPRMCHENIRRPEDRLQPGLTKSGKNASSNARTTDSAPINPTLALMGHCRSKLAAQLEADLEHGTEHQDNIKKLQGMGCNLRNHVPSSRSGEAGLRTSSSI